MSEFVLIALWASALGCLVFATRDLVRTRALMQEIREADERLDAKRREVREGLAALDRMRTVLGMRLEADFNREWKRWQEKGGRS